MKMENKINKITQKKYGQGANAGGRTPDLGVMGGSTPLPTRPNAHCDIN